MTYAEFIRGQCEAFRVQAASFVVDVREGLVFINEMGRKQMIKEAIDKVEQMADAARKPFILAGAPEPGHIYYLVQGGKAEKVVATPQPRNHQPGDLESLVSLVKRHSSPKSPGSVWCSRKAIVAHFNDGERRDRAAIVLPESTQMKMLAEWAGKPTPLDQQSLIRILRIVFSDAVSQDVVDQVRTVKWKHQTDSESVAQHGKASLGKSIIGTLAGADKIPQELTFNVPAFEGGMLFISCVVRAAVEIHVEAEKVSINPLAGEIKGAWEAVERTIFSRMEEAFDAEAHVQVFRGEP